MREHDLPSESALVPHPLAVAGAWGWRLIVLGVIGWAIVQVLAKVPVLVIALLAAVLLTALLSPGVTFARRHGWPAGLAAVVLVLGSAAALAAAITVIADGISRSLAGSAGKLSAGWSGVVSWLGSGPLHLHVTRWDQVGAQTRQWVSAHAAELSRGVWTVGASALEVVVGVLLCLLVTILLLADGRGLWHRGLALLPRRSRGRVHHAARAGWRSLGVYVRTQMLIASLEGVLVGVGALILGVPLAPVLGVLVFVTAFIPVLGILIAGGLCVLLALASKGVLVALVMLALVVVVHEVELHILQPWLMGHAVAVHPLGVIIAVTAATMLVGIAGAVFAIPFVAFVSAAIRELAGEHGAARVDSSHGSRQADALP